MILILLVGHVFRSGLSANPICGKVHFQRKQDKLTGAKLAINTAIKADFMYAEQGKFDFTKLAVGIAIGAACDENVNLDAALQFAGTVGVDAGEDIWGIAEQTTDALSN